MIDVVLSIVFLVVLWPLFVGVAFLVHIESPGPILFRQVRLGHHQREFVMLKFRTMRVGTRSGDHEDFIAVSANRHLSGQRELYKLRRCEVTGPVGRFLRKSSIDELPQLWNVLRGDMSLVGPRPCLPYELKYFEEQDFTRFDVPQGVTGLWQVEGRAAVSFRAELDLDVEYVLAHSLPGDMKILALTPMAVLAGWRRTA